MGQPNSSSSSDDGEERVPSRDWILLPVLGIATICVLAGCVEFVARMTFTYPKVAGAGEDCMVFNDPSTGARGIPNCVRWEKIPEGVPTEYRFNNQGYRNDFDFSAKPKGTFRIVMIGTSFAAGFRVPDKQTFGALLPIELSSQTQRRVELYDEGLPWRSPDLIARHFKEVLSAQPDLILWILVPKDIEGNILAAHDPKPDLGNPPERSLSSGGRFDSVPGFRWVDVQVNKPVSHARSVFLLRHFLYESQSQYVKSSLVGGDLKNAFLQTRPSEIWQQKLKQFDTNASDIENQATSAGIPIVAVLVPDRAQAAMISMMGNVPDGYDPYKLGNDLRSIIVRHGGNYIDILPEFRAIANPQWDYFPLEGHLNAQGHAIVSALLAKKLTSGSSPLIRTSASPDHVQVQGR